MIGKVILIIFGLLFWSNGEIKEIKNKWLASDFRPPKSNLTISVVVKIWYLVRACREFFNLISHFLNSKLWIKNYDYYKYVTWIYKKIIVLKQISQLIGKCNSPWMFYWPQKFLFLFNILSKIFIVLLIFFKNLWKNISNYWNFVVNNWNLCLRVNNFYGLVLNVSIY